MTIYQAKIIGKLKKYVEVIPNALYC